MSDSIRQPRALVVDDDPRSRRLLRGLLEPVGTSVTEAAGGAEALTLLESGGWDLVLLDLSMPGMDGFEVLERIRERWGMEDLPVILVTGMDDADARLRGLQLRANEFLAKPVDQAELLARVGAQLAYRFARLELQERVRELEEARSVRDFLTDTVLRELRSPMTTIIGNLELARDELDGSSRGRRLLDASAKAAREAAALAGDTADLIRLADGRLRPHPAPVGLAGCLHRAVEAVEGSAAGAGIRLVHTPGPGLPEVRGDARLMGRALTDLLRQAVADTPAGGWVEVAAGPGPDGRVAVVTIHSSEPVLAEAVLRELARDRASGFGVAVSVRVALARGLIEAMGAKLHATVLPTRGSALEIAWPVDRETAIRATGAVFAPGANPV